MKKFNVIDKWTIPHEDTIDLREFLDWVDKVTEKYTLEGWDDFKLGFFARYDEEYTIIRMEASREETEKERNAREFREYRQKEREVLRKLKLYEELKAELGK